MKGNTAARTATDEHGLVGLDRAIKARAAALEALSRTNPAALDGFALQKQLAGERFEASPKRKAKVAAWMEAMDRGEIAALDVGPEMEEAERWACAEISRRAGAEAGFELVREPGVTYVRAARERPRSGRSPRPATNDRRRGSRRRPARRSSERSGDSGEDGESEPSQVGRLCDCGCGLPLAGRRSHCRFLNDAHRKRYQRQQDRLVPDRVPERRLVLLAEAKAPPPVRCKCDPKGHLVDEGVCLPCGRARGNGGAGWLGDISSRQLSVHQPSRAREWRTRPSRREAARLRSTRRDYIDESIITAVAA